MLGPVQLVHRRVEPAALDLQRRLLAQTVERGRGETGDARVGWQRGETGDRVHALRLELEPLVALQHRDERQVVVVAALVDAALPPRAEVALADRVRVRGLGARGELGAAGQEMLRDTHGVGVELLWAERRALAVAEDEVHPDGAAALDALDLSVVEE